MCFPFRIAQASRRKTVSIGRVRIDLSHLSCQSQLRMYVCIFLITTSLVRNPEVPLSRPIGGPDRPNKVGQGPPPESARMARAGWKVALNKAKNNKNTKGTSLPRRTELSTGNEWSCQQLPISPALFHSSYVQLSRSSMLLQCHIYQ